MDGFEVEAEFSEEEDLLEDEELVFFVISVSVIGVECGFEEADFVVPMESAGADA